MCRYYLQRPKKFCSYAGDPYCKRHEDIVVREYERYKEMHSLITVEDTKIVNQDDVCEAAQIVNEVVDDVCEVIDGGNKIVVESVVLEECLICADIKPLELLKCCKQKICSLCIVKTGHDTCPFCRSKVAPSLTQDISDLLDYVLTLKREIEEVSEDLATYRSSRACEYIHRLSHTQFSSFTLEGLQNLRNIAIHEMHINRRVIEMMFTFLDESISLTT